MSTYIIAGIGTDVGKTVVAAVMVEALNADYWKPVQAGALENTDSHEVARLAPGPDRHIHTEAFRLTESMSPHAAAAIDGVTISSDALAVPPCDRPLIIELAGGLMVPVAPNLFNIDLLGKWNLPVILVSRYYLGSINHTLLSVDALRQRNIPIAGLVFVGDVVETTRSAIIEASGLPVIAQIPIAQELSTDIVRQWAQTVQL